MQTTIVERLRTDFPRKLIAGTALLLAGSAMSCKDPGYRNEITPGQQGQYTLQRVPDSPRPSDSSAQVQAEAQTPPPAAPVQPAPAQGAPANAPAPAPMAAAPPSTGPTDENFNQVQAMWPKLSDSDKALLAETAKHLAAQK
jgi:hypothetical protein